jgi:hypothetical protein
MKRNTGLVLLIILLTLIATSLGYYFGKRASMKDVPIESTVATEVVTTDSLEATPALSVTGQKQYITVDGAECEIAQKTENPYTKDEYVIATARNCGGERRWAPRFFVQNSTGTSEITKITADSFQYSNPWPLNAGQSLFVFHAPSEIIYASVQGEGAACGGGFLTEYVQFDYKTGAYKKIASFGQSEDCHNPIEGTEEVYVPSQCWDTGSTYEYNGNKIGIKSTCQNTFNPTPALVEVTYNEKSILSVLAKTQVESGKTYVPSKAKGIEFDPFQATLNLLAKKETVTFSLENSNYTLNLKTGILSTQ